MKKLLLLSLVCFVGLSMRAQVVLGYFPFNYGEVQLTSPQSYLFFADGRIETNSFITNLNVELGVALNLKRSEQYNVYLGSGLRFNPFAETTTLGGYYFPLGVRWRPVVSLPSLGVVFEFSPILYERVGEGLALRTKLGLSYAF